VGPVAGRTRRNNQDRGAGDRIAWKTFASETLIGGTGFKQAEWSETICFRVVAKAQDHEYLAVLIS